MKCSTKVCILGFITYFLLTFYNTTYAGVENKSEDEVKAQIVLKYLPYVSWPSKAQHSNINICVIEGDLIGGYLDKINSDSNRKFNINILEKGNKDELSVCNILYINKSYKKYKDYFISITKARPIVTISDIPGFAAAGGITGFQIVPGKDIELEVNMKAVKASKIEFDADLLQIMKIFK